MLKWPTLWCVIGLIFSRCRRDERVIDEFEDIGKCIEKNNNERNPDRVFKYKSLQFSSEMCCDLTYGPTDESKIDVLGDGYYLLYRIAEI